MSGTLNFLNFDIPFFGRTARHEHALKLKAQQRMKQILNGNSYIDASDPQLKGLLSEINKAAQRALEEHPQELMVDSPSIAASTTLPPDSESVIRTIDDIAQSTINQDAEKISARVITAPVGLLPSPPATIVDEFNEISQIATNLEDSEAATIEPLATAPQTAVQVVTDASPTPIPKPISNEADNTKKQKASKAEVEKKPPLNLSASIFSLALKNLKFVLPAIPILGWLLYSSKQKIVRNIDLSLTSPLERKVYQITLGNKDNAIGVAFEAASGQPLRFLREVQANEEECSNSFSLYNDSKSSLSTSLLGPLSALAWKRQEQHVVFDITVNEPFANEFLEKGPSITTHPISDKEFIRINHRRYRLNPISAEDRALPFSKENCTEDASDWVTRKVSINIGSSDKTHHIALPPLDGSESESSEYVRIEQQKIPE